MENNIRQNLLNKGSKSYKWFFAFWFIIFFLAFFGLYGLGLVPVGVSEIGDSIIYDSGANFISSHENELTVEPTPAPAPAQVASVSADFSDTRIIIPAISVDAHIIFPNSTDVDVLNNGLLKGVVHYPGSALPGEKGKMFLFGHSTTLAVVHNQAFKSFSGLKDLRTGDIVKIQTSDKEYRYRVLTMRIAEVDKEIISFDSEKPMLVLLTCRIVNHKIENDRYMVEAEFMGSYPLLN